MVKTKKKVVENSANEKKDEAPAAAEFKKEESKGVSLGSKKAMTVGRNKSGMPWKKNSKRS